MTQTIAEIDARLVVVRTAITNLITNGHAQATLPDGQSYTYLNLPDLQREEKRLEAMRGATAAAGRRGRLTNYSRGS